MEKKKCYCETEFETTNKRKIYCSDRCRGKAKYYRHHKERREADKKYYHKNRESIIKKKSIAIMKKYKTDPEFRRKAAFKHKTIYLVSLEGKNCDECNSEKDLHRHHPNYDDHTNYTILCRDCHTQLHEAERLPHKIKGLEEVHQT